MTIQAEKMFSASHDNLHKKNSMKNLLYSQHLLVQLPRYTLYIRVSDPATWGENLLYSNPYIGSICLNSVTLTQFVVLHPTHSFKTWNKNKHRAHTWDENHTRNTSVLQHNPWVLLPLPHFMMCFLSTKFIILIIFLSRSQHHEISQWNWFILSTTWIDHAHSASINLKVFL